MLLRSFKGFSHEHSSSSFLSIQGDLSSLILPHFDILLPEVALLALAKKALVDSSFHSTFVDLKKGGSAMFEVSLG